jgi:hypothetical protein
VPSRGIRRSPHSSGLPPIAVLALGRHDYHIILVEAPGSQWRSWPGGTEGMRLIRPSSRLAKRFEKVRKSYAPALKFIGDSSAYAMCEVSLAHPCAATKANPSRDGGAKLRASTGEVAELPNGRRDVRSIRCCPKWALAAILASAPSLAAMTVVGPRCG